MMANTAYNDKNCSQRVKWNNCKDGMKPEQRSCCKESDVTLGSLPQPQFDGVRSAALDSFRLIDYATVRKNSFPISPKTTTFQKDPWLKEIHFDQTEHYHQPVVSQTDDHVSIQESLTPDRSTKTPDPLEVDPFLYLETPSINHILNRQYETFQKLERICTRAAAKYWHSHRSKSADGRGHVRPSTSNYSQHYNPYGSERLGNCKHTRQSSILEPQMTLKDYVTKIAGLYYGRAHALKDNDDTILIETLIRTTQLFDWTEQVMEVAAEGAKGMEDSDIEEAITGARDLVVWLMDGEGEMMVKELFQGTHVYGGLVLKRGE